jgi:thioredoxin-related protein
MKKLLFSLFILSGIAAHSQDLDLIKAEALAKDGHKLILLEFSGSDWCIPCIKMEREVFQKDSFVHYAAENLVVVHADFPRLKKNQLSKSRQLTNEKLAEQFNKKGAFPMTVLLNEDGKVLHEWEGLVAVTPEAFIAEIEKFKSGTH